MGFLVWMFNKSEDKHNKDKEKPATTQSSQYPKQLRDVLMLKQLKPVLKSV